MRPRLALVMFLACLAALAVAAPAHASFPGANGKLVFSFGTLSPPPANGIYTMNPSGGGMTPLLINNNYVPGPWSPDGTKILVSDLTTFPNRRINIMNADGTNLTFVRSGNTPDWSPDGQRLVFEFSGDIYVANADGSDVKRLTQSPPCVSNDPPYPYLSQQPRWSPDGKRIAFIRRPIMQCAFEPFPSSFPSVYLMDKDGANPTQLTASGQEPDWSPDGQRIAFASNGINVINSNGTGQSAITPGNFFGPVWSPDGQKLAFRGYVSGRYDLFAANADGSGLVNLTNTPDNDETDVYWQPLPGSSPAPPYETPKLASPMQMSLVPVFKQCGTGGNPVNGSHSPPLSVGSCPPQTSGVAHFGPQAKGTAWVATIYGDTNPATGDQADMTLRLALSDIRTAAGGDYDPNPAGADGTLVTRLRFTDRANGGSGTDPGTATDFDFSVPFACTVTSDTAVGSNCALDTSADAVNPGMIKENKATVLQVFRLRLNDSGANGVRGDSDDRIFATQGVFVP